MPVDLDPADSPRPKGMARVLSASRLLQMSAFDISRLVHLEIDENPVLEVVDDTPPAYSEERDIHESLPSGAPSLREQVMSQIRMATNRVQTISAAEKILPYLNSSGYLDASLAEIWADTGIPIDEIENALSLIQAQEPCGIGARDLRECLLIQLRSSGRKGSLAEKLVELHLNDLACGRLQVIARGLGTNLDEVQKAVGIVKSLNPRPGAGVSSQTGAPLVVPEASVQSIGGAGEVSLVVVMNDSAIPQIRISATYTDLLHESPPLSRVRAFLEECMCRALWLIRSIEHRRGVLYRVIDAIALQQRGYFSSGPESLRRVSITSIARHSGLQEAMVIRAITDKVIDTPYGMRPLKYFTARH